MKLKYYLRGLGMGVIFATLIMTISSVIHNNNLSDETIIKEAQKLGMVMASETEDTSSLWGNSDSTETEEPDTEAIASTEIGTETEVPVVSETPVESETPDEPQLPAESETPVASETEEQTPTDVPADTKVQITIKQGDNARQVAETLYANGLVDDAEAFRKYFGTTGLANRICVGTFEIPMGATYDQIIAIITL